MVIFTYSFSIGFLARADSAANTFNSWGQPASKTGGRVGNAARAGSGPGGTGLDWVVNRNWGGVAADLTTMDEGIGAIAAGAAMISYVVFT